MNLGWEPSVVFSSKQVWKFGFVIIVLLTTLIVFVLSYQIPDKDLEKRRCEQRVDPLTDTIYTKSEYAPEVLASDAKDKDDEEEEEEEEEEAEEEMNEEEEEVSYMYDNSDEFQHAFSDWMHSYIVHLWLISNLTYGKIFGFS